MVKLRTLHRNLKLLMRVKEGRILLFAFPRRFGGKILQNLPLHYQILSSASVMVPPLAVVCIGTKTVRRLQKSFISAVSVVFKLYRFGNSPISLEKSRSQIQMTKTEFTQFYYVLLNIQKVSCPLSSFCRT